MQASSVSDTYTPQTSISLLDLPWEVRNMIYEELVALSTIQPRPRRGNRVLRIKNRRGKPDPNRWHVRHWRVHLLSCGWPALPLMLSCKQIAAELRLFVQPDRVGGPVVPWHASIRLDQAPRTPLLEWHSLSCPPAAVRSIIVDVKLSGVQIRKVEHYRDRDTDWWLTRRISPPTSGRVPGVQFRFLWDMLDLLLHRGPRMDSHRLLGNHIRLDELTLRLIDNGVQGPKRGFPLDPYLGNHDACCIAMGISPDMHIIFDYFDHFIKEGMRSRVFQDYVERVTCRFEHPHEVYTSSHDSSEMREGERGDQLSQFSRKWGFKWEADRYLG